VELAFPQRYRHLNPSLCTLSLWLSVANLGYPGRRVAPVFRLNENHKFSIVALHSQNVASDAAPQDISLDRGIWLLGDPPVTVATGHGKGGSARCKQMPLQEEQPRHNRNRAVSIPLRLRRREQGPGASLPASSGAIFAGVDIALIKISHEKRQRLQHNFCRHGAN
jgi:hypothetical protein